MGNLGCGLDSHGPSGQLIVKDLISATWKRGLIGMHSYNCAILSKWKSPSMSGAKNNWFQVISLARKCAEFSSFFGWKIACFSSFLFARKSAYFSLFYCQKTNWFQLISLSWKSTEFGSFSRLEYHLIWAYIRWKNQLNSARLRGWKINWFQFIILAGILAHFSLFSWQESQLNSAGFMA